MTAKGPGFFVNDRRFDDRGAFVASGCRCATAIPTMLQIARVDDEIRTFRRAVARIERVVVNVQFIHITAGDEGAIEEQQRVDQIAELNDAFGQHGISFEYEPDSVVVVDRPEWFRMGHRSAAERAAKTALQVDPATNLNFYTAGLQRGLLGWATFPFDLDGDPALDGTVVLHSTLPGGSATPFDLGRTGTHEVGHWLGLYHTFEPQGRCDDVGDFVDDTVAHADPDYGTPPEGVYSACDGKSNSPIHNFMNYTDDEWMTHFTELQGQRMRDQVGLYRPGLVQQD
jgi:hypothetical protein